MLLDKSFHKFPLRLFWESIFHSFTRETIQIGKGKAAEAQIRKKLYKKKRETCQNLKIPQCKYGLLME